jgi:hypothetical protein
MYASIKVSRRGRGRVQVGEIRRDEKMEDVISAVELSVCHPEERTSAQTTVIRERTTLHRHASQFPEDVRDDDDERGAKEKRGKHTDPAAAAAAAALAAADAEEEEAVVSLMSWGSVSMISIFTSDTARSRSRSRSVVGVGVAIKAQLVPPVSRDRTFCCYGHSAAYRTE